ncbi:MAG: right-handed parallel beta-helix repeat-containing protein [Kiritimatiellia bacterium]
MKTHSYLGLICTLILSLGFSVSGVDYYINDLSTSNDVYCSAIGSDANTGTSPASPMLTMTNLLSTKDLEPGDTVFIDSGTYTNIAVVTTNDQGSSGGYVTFQGSTNAWPNGSLLKGVSVFVDTLFDVVGANYIQFRDMTLQTGVRGAYLRSSAGNCRFENVAFASIGTAFQAASGSISNMLFDCSFVSNYYAVFASGTAVANVDKSVFFNNTINLYVGTDCSVSNSVLSGGQVFGLNVMSRADYNLISTTNWGLGYDSLASVQKTTGGWKWSTVADPQMAAPGAMDFHPKSIAGRYDPATAGWVTDAVHSAMIDFGDPSRSAVNEPLPNGGRMNIGIHGNTDQASRSRTNLWLFALSFNDVGTLSAGVDPVYWTGNLTNGQTVRIEYSGDAGTSWYVAQTGILASAGTWLWSNTNFPSSKLARWKVVYEANTNIFDVNNTNFVFKTGVFTYFINDSSLAGDVFTSAIGNNGNTGTSSNAPKATLKAVLDEHDMEPGDIIYIDTGTYNLSADQTVVSADGGDSNAYVYIRGSTNGTVFNRNNLGTTYALILNNADYVDIADIEFRRAGTGIYLGSADNVRLTNVRAVSNATAGINIVGSLSAGLNGVVASLNGGNGISQSGASSLQAQNCVLWRNSSAGLRVSGGTAVISNSVLVASGLTAYVYHGSATNSIQGDYNDIYAESNAVAGYLQSIDKNIDNLSEWIVRTGRERNSLATDPLFANPQGGDFHLKTQTPAGRYVKGLGFATNDAVTSPLIDAGNPAEAAPLESSRKNIGLYGNTGEASIGRTNPWIHAATLEGGGIVSGAQPLHWVAVNATNGTMVDLEISPDGGTLWSAIATGIPATNEIYIWNTAATNDTPVGLFRIVSPSVTDLRNETSVFFRISNTGAKFYFVNDGSLADDRYTTAAGSSGNLFATSNAPMDSLGRLFDAFNLEPGDRIYMDSGSYTASAGIAVSRLDGGKSGDPVIIQGSTNETLTKSVINRGDAASGTCVVEFSGTEDVVIRNLDLEGADTGLRADTAGSVLIERVEIRNNGGSAVQVLNSSSISLLSVLAEANGGWGLESSASSVNVQHSLIWSNALGAVSRAGGSMTLYNNILGASGSGAYIFNSDASSGFVSDYNNILLSDLARMAYYDYETYTYPIQWRDASSNDFRSLSHNPGFFDASSGDYHLTSPAGRYVPGAGFQTNAAESFSVLIDAGNPAQLSFTNEPVPNGGRVNIGLYGGSSQASKTPETNGWLTVLTLNGGGSMRGTNTLYWLAGGVATGHTYTLQVSLNNGATWSNVVTGLAAGTDSYNWNSSLWGSSAEARWQIVSETNSAIFGTNDVAFLLDNGALTFYVNDANLDGDIYTTAAGSALNSGLYSNKPKASIKDVLDSYGLKAGDKILVDTGTYMLNDNLVIGSPTVGLSTNPVVIQGSTNFNSAGTVLNRQGGSFGFFLNETAYIHLKNFTVQNAATAVGVDGSDYCLVDSVTAVGGATSFAVRAGTSNVFMNCLGRNASSRGLYARQGASVVWMNGVLWSNTVGVYSDDAKLTMMNSVIGAFGDAANAYFVKGGAITNQIVSDYNNMRLQDGARAAYYDAVTGAADDRSYENLAQWVWATGRDAHSLSDDPGFASAVSNDFHLLSPAGRFDPGSGFVTNPAESASLLLDAGSPASGYTNEPAPNGLRVNIGMYGNTVQASKSPTNSVLAAVSLNDGGQAAGVYNLYWLAGGDATGHTVTIEFSADGGATWSTLTSGVSAATGIYSWNTALYPSTPLGVWRITSDMDGSLTDQTEAFFAVRNGWLSFYVNDAATNGDMYCSQAGASVNTGAFTNDPKDSVQDVLDTYDLEPGDVIYVDTGSYTLTEDIAPTLVDMGTASNKVVIQGSSNRAAGGAVFGDYGFNLTWVQGMDLRDLIISNSTYGVYMSNAADCDVEEVDALDCSYGFYMSGNGTHDVMLRRCSAQAGVHGIYTMASASAVWENGLLWSNTYGARINGGVLEIRNTVVGSLAAGQYGYYWGSGVFTSDYNVVYLTNGAYAGYVQALAGDQNQPNLSRWVRATGSDAHSLSHEPGFYSATSNDFHALSPAGRYAAGTGYVTNIAEALSVLVDSGDPLSDFSSESEPNGARINIGRYGGGDQASLSPTNARLIAVSLNDGGRVEGTKELTWVASGDATGHTVKIEFSHDAGITWTTLVTGVSAVDESWSWDTTMVASTPVGVWRVVSESDGAVSDQADNLFSVRNDPLFYYVNDTSLTGDIYCSAMGSVSNTGAFSSAPKLSVQDILNTYDLEPGDTIYVDTGVYSLSANIQPDVFDAGTAASRISLVGSTNYLMGGTKFTQYGINLDSIDGWAFSHLIISGASTALRLYRADDCEVRWVQALDGVNGFEINTAYDAVFEHCVAAGNASIGVNNRNGYDTQWGFGVVWSNFYGVQMWGGSFQFQNSVIGAMGSGRYAYYVRETGLDDLSCDYNNIYVSGGGYAGLFYALAGRSYDVTYVNVSRWVHDFGTDLHSLSHDPLFADAVARDFHLSSPAGRFSAGAGFITNVSESISPLIDAGDPLSGFAAEPEPNGRRVNIGLYGNTPEASKTPTNAVLTVISLNSGGRIEDSSDLLWLPAGAATGHTVTIEYSSDGGQSWTALVTGVSASLNSWTWDTTLVQDSMLGSWRITSDDDPSVSDTNDALFAVRNAPIAFYVNDVSVSGDIYSYAVGNSTNNGLNPYTPQSSLQTVLDTYDLEPGDTVYVDTGSYTLTAQISVSGLDGGAATNLVAIQGSTSDVNRTVFTAFGPAYGFNMALVNGVALRNFSVRNATMAGLYFDRTMNCGAEAVICETGRDGFYVKQAVSALFNHCVARANTRHGLWNQTSTGTEWDGGVIWSNVNGVNLEGGDIKVENSVLGALSSQQQGYRFIYGSLVSDYNNIYRENGGCAGVWVSDGVYTTKYDAVSSWYASLGYDEHSLSVDPGFWDKAGGDYHLRSPAGRYLPGTGFVTNVSEVASLLIDAGDPASSVGLEPVPNGGRVNIGLYGGTGQASKTSTNATLIVSSLDDGGYATGTVSLIWLARGAATGHTVYIEFSGNGGATWTTLVSGIAANLESWVWDTTLQSSTPLGAWRITSLEDPSVTDQSAVYFAIRNTPFSFYVNDSSTIGDVYTLVAGSAVNSGLTPAEPRASIQAVLDSYDLEAGDTIWVDTGTYALSSDLIVGALDSGTTNLPVTIRGSTNMPSGGTVIDRQVAGGGTAAVRVNNAVGVVLKDLILEQAETGVSFENSSRNCAAEGLIARDNASAGFQISLSYNITLRNSLSVDNGQYGVITWGGDRAASFLWENGVIWNSGSAINLGPVSAGSLRNSYLQGDGSGNRVVAVAIGASLASDYNNYAVTNGALLLEQERVTGGNLVYSDLSSWIFDSGQDRHSLTHDPKFADPDNGDFHLKSAMGRYEVGTGYATNDAPGTYSPMLDTGYSTSAYTNETPPNGGRVNMGMFGNTGQSSLSRTNAWLLAITLNGGGVISGTQDIYWAYGNIASGSTVKLEYSLNGGIEFFNLATNIPVSEESYPWDVSHYNNTLRGLWRVTLESDPLVYDTVDNEFNIRNETRNYYVNDTNTAGDVYTTAPGSSTNTGLTVDSPVDSPLAIMQNYAVLAGDQIFIDTGTYIITNDFKFSTLNRGVSGLPIRVVGSTNTQAGGTVIDRNSTNISSAAVILEDAAYIELEHLKLTGAGRGLLLDDSLDCSLTWIEAYENLATGIDVGAGYPYVLNHCLAQKNGGWGVRITSPLGKAFINHSVFWSNRLGSAQAVAGYLYISNSILHASGPTNCIYELDDIGYYFNDYNILWQENQALLGRDVKRKISFRRLQEWQNDRGQDRHSVLSSPRFADPAAGDFHLKTDYPGGRYVPQSGTWTSDTETSWAIDAGDFTAAYANEPAPNGSRLNSGLYGNTWQASKTSTNAQFMAVTLNDGGSINGPVTLYWLAMGIATDDTVRLDYSFDAGFTWTNIVTGLNPHQDGYYWNPEGFESSPNAFWRVVSETDTNCMDAVDTNFLVRVGTAIFYLNDTNTTGDVYCLAPGDSANSGLSSVSPMLSIQQLLDAYDIAPGDMIYVDTGYYLLAQDLTINVLDSGISTARVTVAGSPDYGTVFDRGDTTNEFTYGIIFNSAVHVAMSNIVVQNADVGVDFNRASSCMLSDSMIRDSTTYGVRFFQSSSNVLKRTVITRSGSAGVYDNLSSYNLLDGCVVWDSGANALSGSFGLLVVSNSVLHASGDGNLCYQNATGSLFVADYNNLFVENGAFYGKGPSPAGLIGEGMPQWILYTTQDVHSLTFDPLFADPGNDDFHPMSSAGRYEGGVFVQVDTNYSPLIDAGDPNTAVTNEPVPNGGRMNIGAYGNTGQASKSRTNAWVLAVYASAGGRVSGGAPVLLTWLQGNLDATNRVTLEYSWDNGTTWTNIASGVPVTDNQYLWDVDELDMGLPRYPASPTARWRLFVEADASVADDTDVYFSMKGPFTYYINDLDTADDVFTTGIGDDVNLGIMANAPKLTMLSLISEWDIEGGDTIVLDTGDYVISNPVVIASADGGNSAFPVTIMGSTNGAGATVRASTNNASLLQINANYVDVEGLTIKEGWLSAYGNNLHFTDLKFTNSVFDINSRTTSVERTAQYGGFVRISSTSTNIWLSRLDMRSAYLQVLGGADMLLENALFSGTASYAVSLNNAQRFAMRNCTLAVLGNQFVQSGASLSEIENNIMIADGPTRFCILQTGGTLDSDYNTLVTRNGAWFGNAEGQWEKLIYWQEESGLDTHSLPHEPLFVNEAGGDYHLQSYVGSWNGTIWSTNANHSPAIDAGNPSTVFTNEPFPRGPAVNMGAYGGTEEASKSRLDPWLLALTVSDGGVLIGTNTIYWLSGNLTTNTLQLAFTSDGGATWVTIASGISAGLNEYVWDTTAFVTNSVETYWRVMVEANTNVLDVTDEPFSIRNGPINFYLNDTNTVGDVFCGAPGDDANDGLTTNTPMLTLTNLLVTYDLEGFDTVYIDVGYYKLTTENAMIWSDAGREDIGNLLIQGAGTGTVFSGASKALAANALRIYGNYIDLRDFTVRDAGVGILLPSNRFVTAEGLLIVSNAMGMKIQSGADCAVVNSLFLYNTNNAVAINGASDTIVENNTFYGNIPASISITSAVGSVLQNNIFGITVADAKAYGGSSNDVAFNVGIDYNVYYFEQPGYIYDIYNTLLPWQLAFQKDYRSAVTNPLFASVADNDFHLQSAAGRYVPGTGFVTTDTNTSWAIDKGDPDADYSLEPEVNGNRINIGRYGGTPEASKGITNAFVYARSLNDPVFITATNSIWPLIWHTLNVPTGTLVTVQYSGDGGITWHDIATGLNAYQEYVIWQPSYLDNSYSALWRVIDSTNAPVYVDTNDTEAALFFGTFEISEANRATGTNLHYIVWRGAWNEPYQVQHSYAFTPRGDIIWSNCVDGVGSNQAAYRITTIGGDFRYEDPESSIRSNRLYRVKWIP